MISSNTGGNPYVHFRSITVHREKILKIFIRKEEIRDIIRLTPIIVPITSIISLVYVPIYPNYNFSSTICFSLFFEFFYNFSVISST